MKLLFTGLLVAASGAVSAHTGDHQGLWHDHGQMDAINCSCGHDTRFISGCRAFSL